MIDWVEMEVKVPALAISQDCNLLEFLNSYEFSRHQSILLIKSYRTLHLLSFIPLLLMNDYLQKFY